MKNLFRKVMVHIHEATLRSSKGGIGMHTELALGYLIIDLHGVGYLMALGVELCLIRSLLTGIPIITHQTHQQNPPVLWLPSTLHYPYIVRSSVRRSLN